MAVIISGAIRSALVSACVAMASHPGVTLPGDISGTAAYFLEDQDPTTEPMVVENSQVIVPNAIGRGWQVDEEKLVNITTKTITFGSRRQF